MSDDSTSPPSGKRVKPSRGPKRGSPEYMAKRNGFGGPTVGGGKPAYEPTDAHRAIVEAAVTGERTAEQIARFLSIDLHTLKKYYAKELETGLTGLITNASLIVRAALDNTNPLFAQYRVQTALTVLKCRGGWSESVVHRGKVILEQKERAENTKARLGEMVAAGDHIGAAQAYEELLIAPQSSESTH